VEEKWELTKRKRRRKRRGRLQAGWEETDALHTCSTDDTTTTE